MNYRSDTEALLRSADRAQAIPSGTGIVNLDEYPAPNLVIEVAKTSLLMREHPTFAEIMFLWGGHPARPVAVAGETPAPQEDVFA